MHRSIFVAATLCAVSACSGGKSSGSTGTGPSSRNLQVKSATFSLTLEEGGSLGFIGEGRTWACGVVGTGQATYTLDPPTTKIQGGLAQSPGPVDKYGNPVFGSLNLFFSGTSKTSLTSPDCPPTGPTAYAPCGPDGTAFSAQMLNLTLTAPSPDSPIRVIGTAVLSVPVSKAFTCSQFASADARVDLDATTPGTLTQLASGTGTQTWEFSGTRELVKDFTSPTGQLKGTEKWSLTLEVAPGT